MNTAEISIAGKTFLAGEYLALAGGPALILATEPCFRLVIENKAGQLCPFHPQSPAGQWWHLHQAFFSRYTLHFRDPYPVGGFGASSAQFALLHAFWQLKDSAFTETQRFWDWHQMLQDYRGLSYEGLAPSGADVVGACAGGLTWFDRNNGKLQTFAWPFQEVEFFLVSTGQKLATHEHLQSLSTFAIEEFQAAMKQMHQALSEVNFPLFLDGLIRYRQELTTQRRVSPLTETLLQRLEAETPVLFAKGCGALGADVVLALVEKKQALPVLSWLQEQNLKVIANSAKISSGLQIRSRLDEVQI